MLTYISVILFALNLVHTVDLPEKPKAKPLSICSNLIQGVYAGSRTPFNCPDPGPLGINGCDCSDCDYFTLYWDCPANGCCIDYITFSSPDGTSCFSACAFLMTPQAPSWRITDASRSDHCNTQDLTLAAPSSSTGLCPRGSTLAIQLCGTASSTYHFQAHWKCDDNQEGFISGDFTIDL